MAMGADIRFDGIQSLRKAMESIPAELRKGTYRKAITRGAQVATRAAKVNARKVKDTGALAKSIGHRISKSGTSAKIGARRGFKQSAPAHRATASQPNIDPFNYAHLVELGTSHSSANPYLRPAVENNQARILNAIAAGIDEGLGKEVAKAERKARSIRR